MLESFWDKTSTNYLIWMAEFWQFFHHSSPWHYLWGLWGGDYALRLRPPLHDSLGMHVSMWRLNITLKHGAFPTAILNDEMSDVHACTVHNVSCSRGSTVHTDYSAKSDIQCLSDIMTITLWQNRPKSGPVTIPKCPFSTQELSPCDNYLPVTIFARVPR